MGLTGYTRKVQRMSSPFRKATVIPYNKDIEGNTIKPAPGTLNIMLEGTGDVLHDVPYLIPYPEHEVLVLPPAGTGCLVAIIGSSAYILGFTNSKVIESSYFPLTINTSNTTKVGNCLVSQTANGWEVSYSYKSDTGESKQAGLVISETELAFTGTLVAQAVNIFSGVYEQASITATKAAFTFNQFVLEVASLMERVTNLEHDLYSWKLRAETAELELKTLEIKSKFTKIETDALILGKADEPAVLGTKLVQVLTDVIRNVIQIPPMITPPNPGATTIVTSLTKSLSEISAVLSTKVTLAK